MITELLKRIFYPDDFGCIICSKRGTSYTEHSDAVICDECIKTFIKTDGFTCKRCGRKVGAEDSLCEACAKYDFAFEKASSVYEYNGSMRTVIHKLKYSGEQWLAEFASSEMAKKLYGLKWNFDIITYVPMYHTKEVKRGYNQARLLAEIVGKKCGVECIEILERNKNTIPQSFLDKDERMKNLVGAIKVKDNCKENIKDKKIIVIDDILTTGSSLNECAKALLASGATDVSGLCLCSVSD